MNFTEHYRARTLAFVVPSSEGSASGWKGYAIRATALAVGFGLYILLVKRKDWSDRIWSVFRRRDASIEPRDNSTNEVKEVNSNNNRSVITYNGEVCPICLGTPKIGVKAPCGHLLCAECLASYCDVRLAPAPPPCPLCRAPLNSVALACDFAILGPKMLDPNTIMVQNWIREYNNQGGLMTSVRPFLMTRITLLFNILTLFLILGLIAVRLQILTENFT
ncbi:E3 ubiquitin-protein ligase RNF170-like isoform X2 [Pseudomyrmex gracilis]|uniref:E3 ubiquitin-protein ligase RNF170-like isoform X2 n=1 Tax=Pseudomyrmex gracilis TaxID=219809 RepID=UPI00099561DE|nr:E3 ubiquitin-protein ligase RNF170-like isoform X2 [Pseudomyrmex gracilis]